MVCEHEYMNVSPPPPIIKLATALYLQHEYRLFTVWEVRAEIPGVLEAARDRRSRDASKTEEKYFSVRTNLNGK